MIYYDLEMMFIEMFAVVIDRGCAFLKIWKMVEGLIIYLWYEFYGY